MAQIGIPDIDPKLEKDLLASMAEVESLLRDSIEGKYPLVIETSRHLVDAGGKRLRPLLTLIASHFGDPKAKGIIEAAVVCELTHLGTLYHDDVMDEAPLRRGVESANNRWNNTVAILTGDYLFAKTSQLLADLGPEAVRLQALTFERLVIGQITETQGSSTDKTALEPPSCSCIAKRRRLTHAPHPIALKLNESTALTRVPSIDPRRCFHQTQCQLVSQYHRTHRVHCSLSDLIMPLGLHRPGSIDLRRPHETRAPYWCCPK
jgi:hypothetical protein